MCSVYRFIVPTKQSPDFTISAQCTLGINELFALLAVEPVSAFSCVNVSPKTISHTTIFRFNEDTRYAYLR